MHCDAIRLDILQEDEEQLALRMARGDNDARSVLAERTMWVAVHAARKYASAENREEDLLSIACVGFVKALNSFDPRRKVKLSSYASQCAKNEILMYLRQRKKWKNEVSLEEPLAHGWWGRAPGDAILPGGEDVVREVLRKEDSAEIQQILGTLCNTDKQILELRFGLRDERERTQKEVAKILGVTQSCVSKREHRLLRDIKAKLRHYAG